jgi:hypothetical protein
MCLAVGVRYFAKGGAPAGSAGRTVVAREAAYIECLRTT